MIVVGLVSFNSCVLYLSCYIGVLVTCAVGPRRLCRHNFEHDRHAKA